MPRTAQPRAGSRTTRSPARKSPLSSATTPTTSWPSTKGGEHGLEEVPELQRGEAARLEVLYALRAGAHEQVARDRLAVAKGEHPLGLGRCAVRAPPPDLPPAVLRRRGEPLVRVYGDGVADGLEHRQVRDGVGVGVGAMEVDASLSGV